VKDARLILLDEPLGNLDYKLREELRMELKNLAAEREAIFVYATPEPIDALSMASHTAILYDGKITQYGPTREVYKKPNHIKSGEYFSDPPMNFFSCKVDGGEAIVTNTLRISLEAMETDIVPGDYVLGIRPHHLSINNGTTTQSVPLAVTVDLAEIVGSDTTLHLSHGHALQFTALVQDFQQFDLGQQITIHFNPRQIHIFDASSHTLVSSAAEVS
jgi:glycerol transport system ATP-binding protein